MPVDLHVYPEVRTTGRTVWKRLHQRVRAWRVGSLRPERLAAADGRCRVFIFTDLERLDAAETEVAAELWERLRGRRDTGLLLNDPSRSARRVELLERLHESGVNDFRVFRATPEAERPTPEERPVIVRQANDHVGRLRLCRSQAELDAELRRLQGDGVAQGDIAMIEFCDVADERGIIRKYGAFRVGDQLIARQIHFSRKWLIRVPDIKTEETAAEERAYVEQNPHADVLLDIFETAKIDYGRVDYGVTRDGRIQVWEINTNPMILIGADRTDPLRGAAHEIFGRRLQRALERLAERAKAGTQPRGGASRRESSA